MPEDHVAKAVLTVDAPSADVWDALIDPAAIKEYMFGATVDSDWREGSAITWTGEWKGKPYQDKGRIVKLERGRRLQYTHFSPLSGQPDTPENYHTVTIDLSEQPGPTSSTTITLTQDHNPTPEAREHSEKNWRGMLDGLSTYLQHHRKRAFHG